MAYLLLKNGTVISGGTLNRKDILLQDDVILDPNFSGELPPNCEVLDAFRQYIAPGFIEIHSHGAGGADMMDATKESFQTLARTHLAHGTTTLYGTTMTAPFEVVKKVVRTFKTCKEVCPNLEGIHSEGIFLSQAQKGAHHENLFHSPTEEETEFILTEGKDIFKRITAAPELPGMLDFSEKMVQNGIQMSIGHSDATSDVAKAAFQKGFTSVTHFYNATPTWRKINQTLYGGVVEAGYLCDDVFLEIIGDGKHVAADCGKLALKVKGPEKLILVSDSLRPAGLQVTESYSGEQIPENRIIIEDGVAKLPDRSFFAGSIALGDTLLKTGVNYFEFGLANTIRMMTENPADLLGRKDIGRIDKGCKANLVILNQELKIQNVLFNGKIGP